MLAMFFLMFSFMRSAIFASRLPKPNNNEVVAVHLSTHTHILHPITLPVRKTSSRSTLELFRCQFSAAPHGPHQLAGHVCLCSFFSSAGSLTQNSRTAST